MNMPASSSQNNNSDVFLSLRQLMRGERKREQRKPDRSQELFQLLNRIRSGVHSPVTPDQISSQKINFNTRLKQELSFPELNQTSKQEDSVVSSDAASAVSVNLPLSDSQSQSSPIINQDTIVEVKSSLTDSTVDSQLDPDLSIFEQVLDEVEATKSLVTSNATSNVNAPSSTTSVSSDRQILSSSAPVTLDSNSAKNVVQTSAVDFAPNFTSSTDSASMLKKPGFNPSAPTQAGSTRKETESPTQFGLEQGTGVQVVEQEKNPELSPEVEKYLQEVEEDKDQAPKEIAIVDEIANLPKKNQFVSQPVIVLPITPEVEERGKRKSPKYSIRWLVEWSQKIIKMFTGKVIYLQPTKSEK